MTEVIVRPRVLLAPRAMIKWMILLAAVVLLAAAPAAVRAQGEATHAPDAVPTPTTVPTASDSISNTTEASTSSSSTAPGDGSSTTEYATNTTTAAPPSADASTTEAPMNATTEAAMMDGSSTAAADATSSPQPSRDSSGRAFGFDGSTDNSTVEKGSLQDLSLDDIDMSMFMTTEAANDTNMDGMMSSMSSMPSSSTAATAVDETSVGGVGGVDAGGMCVEANGTYAPGQRFNRSCDEMCICLPGGHADCVPRCSGPMFRRGSRKFDAACFEKEAADPCCAVMVCASDTETEPAEECQFKNQTYQRGESFKDGCESVCLCAEAGSVSCKPRCSPVNNSAPDRCVALPDPVDSCCTVLRCDVTLTDHDVAEAAAGEDASGAAEAAAVQLVAAEALNATVVRLEVGGELPENATVEASADRAAWTPASRQGLLITDLEPGRTVFLRAVVNGTHSNVLQVALPAVIETPHEDKGMEGGCVYKGNNHTLGEEFHDGCKAFCMCTEQGVQCADLECPTDFGLDVLDPHCLHWEVQPPGFEPVPPRCCPDAVRCVNNGSCEYGGEHFANFAQIPARLTGCERRCYCDAGNVTCQPACQPMPASPPADLACPPHEARLDHVPGDDCCLYWTCPAPQHSGHSTPDYAVTSIPGGFPHLPVSGQPEEVVVQTLKPLGPTSVRVVFAVPPIFVGLHGRIELRYTSDKNNDDLSSWMLQVLAPPQDLLATPTLEFTLGDLHPDTEYRVKITVLLRDLQNTPSSPVLVVHTPPLVTSTLPPVVTMSPELFAAQVNTTSAVITWRRFTDSEMQLIDGVQLRYKQLDDKVYSATPLIHRAVTSYTLTNLQPSTTYEVGIFFIPFQGQTSELQADAPIQITTTEAEDLYKFDVHVEVHHIKATSVEVNWTGVPYPGDKFVNIYRAIYQSDSGKEDFSTFTVAKRDSTSSTLIKDLAPGTRYRLWLEVYLTNGKIKKSNVQDFSTRPGSVSSVDSSHQGKLESAASPVKEVADYYSPLVAVAILAALAIMATLILLLMLMKRRGQTKAAISAGRKSQSAYDNPSYKVEIQQETMDL